MSQTANNVLWSQPGLKARTQALEGAITSANPEIDGANITAERASNHATQLMGEAQKMKRLD